MLKAASKRIFLFFLITFGLLQLVSCGYIEVPGLLLQVDERSLPVLSKKSDSPAQLNAASLPLNRYIFSEPVKVDKAADLAVTMSIKGSVRISLFANEKDAVPFLQANFNGLGEPLLAFHLALPVGATVASVELELSDTESALLKAFSLARPFIGYRAGEGDDEPTLISQGVLRHFDMNITRLPNEIILPTVDGSGWSVVVRQGGEGSIQITGETTGFESSPHPDRPLALPLVAIGSRSVSVTSRSQAEDQKRYGIAQAYLHFGGKAPLSDLHAILAISQSAENSLSGSVKAPEYRLYRWDLVPDTLVFDFSNYAIQDRFLKRLAFFAEKPGFRGRLAADDEISMLHGWNAHDYPPVTLAAFYNLATDTGFKLNQSELALLDLLLEYGIVKKDVDERLKPGKGAIISITRESTAVYRRIFMDHEASHALFFQDEAYRQLAEQLWNAHDLASRQFWIRHLRWRNYDTADLYLSVNELQAYLVQQSKPGAVTYIKDNVLARLAAAYPAEADTLVANTPAILLTAAKDVAALDEYLRVHWDIAAGRFGRVRAIRLP